MECLKKIKKATNELWSFLNRVPDCPMCHGTGEPIRHEKAVYWRGKIEIICDQCGGAGKV